MRTMKFRCPVHGEYEIDLQDGQEPPKWCVIYKEGTRTSCGEVLDKIFFTPNIRFVGSGFYVNDNRKGE